MEQSPLRLIKRCAEFIPIEDIDQIKTGLRGIYALYDGNGKDQTQLVYVGMARGKRGIRARLRRHRAKKEGLWTHCSIFQVWENIRDEEIEELEGLFRHLYRKDDRANRLNAQRGFKKLTKTRNNRYSDWD